MARKSSFVRFGKDFMPKPGEDGGEMGANKPDAELSEKETPRSQGGLSWIFPAVLFLLALGVAAVLFFANQRNSEEARRYKMRSEMGALLIKGQSQFREENFEEARQTFKEALSKAQEYQVDMPDSYIATVSEEVKYYLKQPAIARGKLGSRAQKWADLRKLVKDLDPADIYLQLGEKSGPILEEHLKHMSAEQIAALVPKNIDKLISKKLSNSSSEELLALLGEKLDPVVRKRIKNATSGTLRELIKDRLSEIVRKEIERNKYDIGSLAKLLGEQREDIVRNYIEGAEAEVLAELVEKRFDEIERVMAKKMTGRQAKVTLDDGSVWEGQILHEGPVDMRFLRNDGALYSIPKSRIRKTEPMLQPDEKKEKAEKKQPDSDD